MKHSLFFSWQHAGRCLSSVLSSTSKKMLPLCALAFFSAFLSRAQKTIYQGNSNDRIYGSIATIYRTDPSIKGEGYVLASSALDPSALLSPRGEIIRTDASGNQLWAWQYTSGVTSNWINHIEKYNLSGSTEYLVVGSILNGSNYNLIVARINDNGGLIAQQQLTPGTLRHLVGIKGIATSDKNFALVAMECDGFTAADAKQTIVLELDSLMNLLYSYAYNTTSADYDYDMPTSIEEGADSSEFLIVGSSNKNVDPFYGTANPPCVMSSLINITTGAVTWSYNFSTAGGYHWDAGADGYFDPDDSTFWVLGNSSVLHCFNLTQLDRSTGTPIIAQQYVDASYSGDLDNYGFELKPSLSDPNHFVIGGWKITGQKVIPHLHEVDPYGSAVIWKFRYGKANNRMAAYNDNNWLRVRAAGQFPFFYNNMMSYRSNKQGYSLLGADTSNMGGYEDPELWWGIGMNGHAGCGVDTPWTDSITHYREINDPLQYSPFNPGTVGPSLSNMPVSYTEVDCMGADGEVFPMLGAGRDILKPETSLYPNPASNTWYLENSSGLKRLLVYDTYGRETMNIPLNGEKMYRADISHLPSGIYLVKIQSGNQEITTRKVQIIR